MQAVVRTPRIEISVKGIEIPARLLLVLKEEYGDGLKLVEDDDDDLVIATGTDWYKGVKANMGPGDYLRIYRENKGMTQSKLGEALGGVPRQHISNMERGQRPISLKMARKLTKILDVPISKIIMDGPV
jgi:DNA-binding XRE family transcriptional regulator